MLLGFESMSKSSLPSKFQLKMDLGKEDMSSLPSSS